MSYFKRNIAIIIGINNYQSRIPTLKTATNDANKIARILERQNNYKVWGLVDEKANLADCLRMLKISFQLSFCQFHNLVVFKVFEHSCQSLSQMSFF